MFVETLDSESRSALFKSFFEMTTKALVEIFGRTEQDARDLVFALNQRFSEAPVREQNLLLHNDPVALASELAEVPWRDVDDERLEIFNRRRRQSSSAEP